MTCPLCDDPATCRGYPFMWERLREGRDVEHWRRIHDRLNGPVPMAVGLPLAPAPADPRVPVADALRATKLGFHQCWFSTKDSECGCSGLRCHLKDRIVTLADCITCLQN